MDNVVSPPGGIELSRVRHIVIDTFRCIEVVSVYQLGQSFVPCWDRATVKGDVVEAIAVIVVERISATKDGLGWNGAIDVKRQSESIVIERLQLQLGLVGFIEVV